MKNTDFFNEVLTDSASITWKDIFSESFRKHDQSDIDRAMRVGTTLRQVPESQMLQRWHRPWLWWVLAKYGVGLVIVLYLVNDALLTVLHFSASSLIHMVMIIPPIVIPFVIMIFMWELNVPQNISLLSLISYFLAGGIISFALTTLLFLPVPEQAATYAALREEPAKLGACLVILLYIQRVKKQKLYGLTGLVVGAAVGAAFSGIESVSYAINFSGEYNTMIDVQFQRAMFAIAGHITYCLPYAIAIACNTVDGKITVSSILNPYTIGSFLFSTLMHAVWNGNGGNMIILLILVGISPVILLYWIRKALKDIVRICSRTGDGKQASAEGWEKVPARAAASPIALYCQSGALAGTRWESSGNPLVLGRDPGTCGICFPDGSHGVSRQHCRIARSSNGWYIQDLHSTYGTYVGGHRLAPNECYPLRGGEIIYLGSKNTCIAIL